MTYDPDRRPCCNTAYINPHMYSCDVAAREREAVALSRQDRPEGQKPAPWPGAIAGLKYTPHLSFDGGGLGIRVQGYGEADGSGWFVFQDGELDFEQDDGPLYRIAKVPNSELVAIRDFLNKIFPPFALGSQDRPAPDAEKSDTRPVEGAEPCPFCGSTNIHNWVSTDHGDTPAWSVMCFGCECEGPHCDDEREAIRLWNLRSRSAPDGWVLAEGDLVQRVYDALPKRGLEEEPYYSLSAIRRILQTAQALAASPSALDGEVDHG